MDNAILEQMDWIIDSIAEQRVVTDVEIKYQMHLLVLLGVMRASIYPVDKGLIGTMINELTPILGDTDKVYLYYCRILGTNIKEAHNNADETKTTDNGLRAARRRVAAERAKHRGADSPEC